MSGGGFWQRRRAGVLAHLSSLPGEAGSGSLGRHAHGFIDWLADAGFSVWQMLPLGPTHDDLCPYQCLSVHAGDARFIDQEALEAAGWLPRESQSSHDPRRWRQERLCRARAGRAAAGDEASMAEEAAFRQRHAHWLEDYALYVALRREKGEAPWWEWPTAERDREEAALAAARERLADAIDQAVFEQFLFFSQWEALRRHAGERGVALFGDMPLFVAHDSADVWAHRDYFQLDEAGRPRTVAGVPPDYFSDTGQRWGNPHYEWARMQADGFHWWLDRLATQLELFDFVRLDHFRGLAAYWSIPAEAETARDGQWVPAPGRAFLAAVADRFGRVPLVAEDLGFITEDVEALRDTFGLPGMKVLHFAFDSDADNPYLPHHHVSDGAVYTGTHDNDTTVGWYRGLDPAVAERVAAYLGYPGEEMPWPLIRAALASVAGLAVVPMQDLLALDSDHRMNIPGVAGGDNWRWRFQWEWLPEGLQQRMAEMNRLYGRG
ncbi:4-alpha-glucanotransferase [Alkalilimnicola ehrlichii]|uniref:4-alpha-glucanotransferase n=1 Tax=Alkalilimnicola ehrlichii TaxID=351052 RepID=UPI003BA06ED0